MLRASVSRITSQAKIAQGTFYNHFESRQAILDQLLPALGEDMLAFIKERVDPQVSEIERERQRFEAFFARLTESPEFYRILNEADLFAPKAYDQRIKNMAASYLRALQRVRKHGALSERFSDQELEIIVYMLLGIRSYIGIRFIDDSGTIRPLPHKVTETVIKVLRKGLFN